MDRYRPPAWCRVGIGGIDRHPDLLTAAVVEHLRELLDERLPGVELVVTDDGGAPGSPDDRSFVLDTADGRDLEPHVLVADAAGSVDLLDAAALLLGWSRRTRLDHEGWRERIRTTLPLPEGPYRIVEVGAEGPAVELDTSIAGAPGGVLLIDPWGGAAAVQAGRASGVPAVLDGTAPGLLVDAYVDAREVHGLTRLGPALALRPEPSAAVAATAAIDQLADDAFARVVERDGAAVARRQLTAWARWSTSVWVAHRNAERRHRAALVRSRRDDPRR